MKQISQVFIFVVLYAVSSECYRFICNGMLANGDERSDGCGVCDDENAARWDYAAIEVVVDDSRLPRTVSPSQWRTVVNNSFSAWENVSGSNLRFIERNQSNHRQLGADEDVHEIFWITDRKEWRKQVGSGEFGTLGATLPRYSCELDGSARRIFDADLVLNGLSHINWQIDCQDDNCISPQTTLVHELGHFFGLDHPCLMCSDSIMSARAGFDLTYPVFDDMQGLRALYPDTSNGGFGFPCKADSECLDGGVCVNDGGNHYCSKACLADTVCEFGSVCRDVAGQKVCAFVDDEAAGGQGEGETCINQPCSKPMVCAGASEYDSFCFMPCTNQQDCKPEQTCVAIEDDLSLCVVVKKQGESCNHRELCDNDLYCIFDDLQAGFCRSSCAATNDATTGCPDGQVCHRFLEGDEVCVPPEYGLSLDDNQDGFGQQHQTIPETNPKKQQSVQGCYMVDFAAGNDLVWLIIMMLWCIKKWRPSLSFSRR